MSDDTKWAQLASDCGVTPDCDTREEFVRLMRMVVDQAGKCPDLTRVTVVGEGPPSMPIRDHLRKMSEASREYRAMAESYDSLFSASVNLMDVLGNCVSEDGSGAVEIAATSPDVRDMLCSRLNALRALLPIAPPSGSGTPVASKDTPSK
jgi:hypothetical protein